MNLYTISGRIIIPGTRVTTRVGPVKMCARDIGHAAEQLVPVVNRQIRKDHAKDLPVVNGQKVKVRVTTEFLRMNLQYVVLAAKAVPVPLPPKDEQKEIVAGLEAELDAAEESEAQDIEAAAQAFANEVLTAANAESAPIDAMET